MICTMELKASEKGEVAIPASCRRRLGIHLGDKLKIEVKNRDIILSPQSKNRLRAVENCDYGVYDHAALLRACRCD